MKQSAWDKSIFHLFRARALSSDGPATRAVHPSSEWSADARYRRVVCMTVAPAAAATNLYGRRRRRAVAAGKARGDGGRQVAESKSHHTLSRITSDVNVRLEM